MDADAAKEIKVLITDSVEKVTDGTRLVDETGKTLDEIVNAVKKVSDIIAEIAAASEEQAAGIEQVNKAIGQMDAVTQQNSALVEEMAAASESMSEQSEGLNALMVFFTVDDEAEERLNVRSRNPRPASRQRRAEADTSNGHGDKASRATTRKPRQHVAPAAHGAPNGGEQAKRRLVATAHAEGGEGKWDDV